MVHVGPLAMAALGYLIEGRHRLQQLLVTDHNYSSLNTRSDDVKKKLDNLPASRTHRQHQLRTRELSSVLDDVRTGELCRRLFMAGGGTDGSGCRCVHRTKAPLAEGTGWCLVTYLISSTS